MNLLSFDDVGVRPMRWRKQRSKLYSPGKKKEEVLSVQTVLLCKLDWVSGLCLTLL